MKIYLAGPITHTDVDDMGVGWRLEVREVLEEAGHKCLLPLESATYFDRFGIKDPAPVLTVKDRWFCTKSDLVLANLLPATKASIGTSIELGWADQARVPIVCVMDEHNVHNHPMVHELCTFIVPTMEEAVNIFLALGDY